MPQSLAQLYIHLVFTTNQRTPFLADAAFRNHTHRYLAGVCKNQGSPAISIGGTEDHVHTLLRLGKTSSISELVRELKRDSSKWIKEENPQLEHFHWQQGYGAFSISPSHVNAIKSYISTQEEHHRKESFQDEFRRLCTKYGVELDERYAWD
ncbi:IS200/IS605 family transposase [Aeoliella straminimaris]|uniref:IS200/IS605 family transposase n=1 Tax=Aeoliella straminimaris TaxID=2954799 RepID=UPI00313456EC